MRHIIPVICLLTLAGCTGDVHKLHDLNPPANDFPSALASEYKDYADSELEQGRRFSAEHYAGKGLKSLGGEPVEPEIPDARNQALSDAHDQLMKLLTDDMKRVAPQKLAHAQLLFDCWQNELLKNINQVKAPCEEEFHSTIAELQEIYDALVYGKETKHIILFAPESIQLDAQALVAIKDVAQQVKGLPHYRVQLLVYTGIRSSQRHVTDQRVSAVRHALMKAGVGERHIRVKKAGGAKAVVLSRDEISKDTRKITILVKTHIKPKEH